MGDMILQSSLVPPPSEVMEGRGRRRTFFDICGRMRTRLQRQLKVENIVSYDRESPYNKTERDSSCCIYKVPNVIREVNEEAYTPKVVSIGPFHYKPNSRKLQSMHKHKLTYSQRFRNNRAHHADWNLVLQFVRDSITKVRQCYSESIDELIISNEAFLELILLDACFIIELFLSFNECEGSYKHDDPILSKPWLMSCIEMDLLLLENQLPFFFLQELYQKTVLFQADNNSNNHPSFLKLTYLFFDEYNKQNLESDTAATNILHFTDLLRAYHFRHSKTDDQKMPGRNEQTHVLSYTASQLHEAGVKLKANKSKCLFDLKFSRRTRLLEVPPICVDDETETLYRNVIALEECHYPFDAYITDYVIVLDFLINTSKDVDELIHGGIIVNYLGDSTQVANLFNGLCKNIGYGNFSSDFYKICTDLNAFYKDPWNNMMVTLRRDYCNTPWKWIATFAGILIVALTIAQTVFSVLQLSK